MSYHNINDNVRHGAELAGKQVENLADSAVQAATDQAVRQARSGRNTASDYLHSLSDAAHAAARTLEADGHSSTAGQAVRAAAVIEEIGHTISAYDVEGVVVETANALRARPALAFSLAALGGYAVVKLARSRKVAASDRGGS